MKAESSAPSTYSPPDFVEALDELSSRPAADGELLGFMRVYRRIGQAENFRLGHSHQGMLLAQLKMRVRAARQERGEIARARLFEIWSVYIAERLIS